MAGVYGGYQGIPASPTFVYPGYSSQTYTDAYGNIVDAQGNVLVMSPSPSYAGASPSYVGAPPAYAVNSASAQHVEEKPSFGDKLGAFFKGVLDAPGKIVEGLSDPKNLLILGGAVAASVIFPPAAPVIALVGTGIALKGAAEGLNATAIAWQSDSLDGIREGSSMFSANTIGVALGVKGLKSGTIRSLKAAGIRRVKVGGKDIRIDNISFMQALRLQPKVIKTSMSTFKGSWGNTKGTIFQRMGQMARSSAKGSSRTRIQRSLTGRQRTEAIAKMVVTGVKLVRDIQTSGVGTALRSEAWTAKGASGILGNLGRSVEVLTRSQYAPLGRQVLEFGARNLENFGYAGRTSTGLRVGSELLTARAEFEGLWNHGKHFVTETVRPGTYKGLGGWGTTKELSGNLFKDGWGIGQSAQGLYTKVRLIRDFVAKREGLGVRLAQRQEQAAFLAALRSTYEQLRPFRSRVTGDIAPATARYVERFDASGKSLGWQEVPASVPQGTLVRPGTGARSGLILSDKALARLGISRSDISRLQFDKNGTLITDPSSGLPLLAKGAGKRWLEPDGMTQTARDAVFAPKTTITGAPAAGTPLPRGTTHILSSGSPTAFKRWSFTPRGWFAPKDAVKVVPAKRAFNPVAPEGPVRGGWQNPLGMKAAQQRDLGIELANLFARGRNIYMDMTGRTLRLGRPEIGSPSGGGFLSRFKFGSLNNMGNRFGDFVNNNPGVIPAALAPAIGMGLAAQQQQKIAELQAAYMNMMYAAQGMGDASLTGGVDTSVYDPSMVSGVDMSGGMQQSMA